MNLSVYVISLDNPVVHLLKSLIIGVDINFLFAPNKNELIHLDLLLKWNDLVNYQNVCL